MTSSVSSPARPRLIVGAAGKALRRVLLPLVAAAVSLGVLYLTAVCTVTGQRAEDVAVLGSNVAHVDPPWAQPLLAMLAQDSAIVVAIALPLILGLWRQRIAKAVVLAGAVLAANITTQALKHLVFVRPELGVFSDLGTTNSLPSGTTTLLLSAALAGVSMLPASLRRSPVLVALPTLAVLGGCATIALDWHRPADVVAAVIVVAAWFALAASVIAGVATSADSDCHGGHQGANPGAPAPAELTSSGLAQLSLRIVLASGLCVVAVALVGALPEQSFSLERHGPAAYLLSLGIVLAASLPVVTALLRALSSGPTAGLTDDLPPKDTDLTSRNRHATIAPVQIRTPA